MGQLPRRCDEDYFAYNWSGRQNIGQLWRSTVGILGFGEIGVELAHRLKGFECTVLYHKRHRLLARAEADFNLTYVTQEELMRRSDTVCSLLPYFPETDLSLNAAFFAALKPGALFVHCGAGAVVDEAALIESLRSGHLAGAALDTYTYEPIRPDEPLLALARDPMLNLILTPHIRRVRRQRRRAYRARRRFPQISGHCFAAKNCVPALVLNGKPVDADDSGEVKRPRLTAALSVLFVTLIWSISTLLF